MDGFRRQFVKFCGRLRKRGRLPDEAEDLVQEAYVRLLTYIDRGEKVHEPEAFLARTVANLEIDHARRATAHVFEDHAVEELYLPDATPGPEDEADNDLYVKRTQQVLDEFVGVKTRDAFFMHCLEGMTYEEIGRQLNLSGRSVERHIAKAVAVLSLKKQPRP